MEPGEVNITNVDEIAPLLEERGIRLEDVRQAIAIGETTALKLYRVDVKDRFLCRAVMGKFNVYAEYSPAGLEFLVHSAYAHRIMLAPHDKQTNCAESEKLSETVWNCYDCKVPIEEVNDIGLVYREIELPDAIGYRCPQCGLQLLSETLVMNEMFLAEMMLEAK